MELINSGYRKVCENSRNIFMQLHCSQKQQRDWSSMVHLACPGRQSRMMGTTNMLRIVSVLRKASGDKLPWPGINKPQQLHYECD